MAKGKNNYQEYNGLKFKNETELEFYKLCQHSVKDGLIKSFEYEVKYNLYPIFEDWRGSKIDSIDHTPDFLITLLDNTKIVVDTKGGGSQTHDKVSLIKRKIWMYEHQAIPYYMISKSPAYLGQVWVETSSGHDFIGKLKSKYKKIYPNENVRKYATCKKFLPKDWGEYYDFESIAGLFYIMHKQYTKKELEKMAKQKK